MDVDIAAIFLATNVELSPKAIGTDLLKQRGKQTKVKGSSKEKGVFSLNVDDLFVAVGRMPAPLPWSDLEGPCATSFLWADAAKVLKEHREHLIVTVGNEENDMERLRLLTQVTVAIFKTCPEALGVLWCPARMVIQPPLFIEFATEILPHMAPLHIWLDCRVGKGKSGKTEGFTCGMHSLGFMEFETQSATEPPHELRERFYALARYLIDNGPVIKDGDTIGEDENERIRVVYSDSVFGTEGKVMNLEYTPVGKKKSR